MNIPLPTDNLYKFICLSGLSLFLLITFYDLKTLNAGIEATRKIEISKYELMLDSVQFQNDSRRIDSKMDAFKKLIGKKINPNDIDSLVLCFSSAMSIDGMRLFKQDYLVEGKPISSEQINKWISITIIDNLANLELKNRKLDSIENAIKIKNLELKVADRLNNIFNWPISFLQVFSMIVFIWGARLWYNKKQKYEDILIANQSTSPSKIKKTE